MSRSIYKIFLLLLFMSVPSYALYYFNDVKIQLDNQSQNPVTMSIHWDHGSNWFSTEDSTPLKWDHVVVPANGSEQSMFSVIIFPRNKHAWSVDIRSEAGKLIGHFSESDDSDLVSTTASSHQVTVTVKPGACQISLERNGIKAYAMAPDSETCFHGVVVEPASEEGAP